jgi:hypothetical protein
MTIINPTNNKTIITVYYSLWEIFTGISSFIIFFGFFIKFYFHDLENTLLNGYISKSLAFYKPIIDKLDTFNIFRNNINQIIDLDKLNKELKETDVEINNYNSEYDNLLLKFVALVLLIFAAILFLPVILGLISYEHINWTYVLTNLVLHLILIIIFEIILLYIIIPINNPIHIGPIFTKINL